MQRFQLSKLQSNVLEIMIETELPLVQHSDGHFSLGEDVVHSYTMNALYSRELIKRDFNNPGNYIVSNRGKDLKIDITGKF